MGLDLSQDYIKPYHTYPIFSTNDGYDGSQKLYSTPPTPENLYKKALQGLPKVYPLTGEPIELDDVAPYLTSAYNELVMDLGCDLLETEHFHSADYIAGMFDSNFTGIKLSRWPAFKVLNVKFKFAHTQTNTPIMSYTIPSSWVVLRRNRINIAPSYGGMIVQTNAETNAAGVFQYITGFARGNYTPANIEIQYCAGFDSDRFPSLLQDLILTVATIRLLTDFAPKLFPYSATMISLDGISQSAQLPGPMFLQQTLLSLQQKREQLTQAFTKYFGRTVKMSFIGA